MYLNCSTALSHLPCWMSVCDVLKFITSWRWAQTILVVPSIFHLSLSSQNPSVQCSTTINFGYSAATFAISSDFLSFFFGAAKKDKQIQHISKKIWQNKPHFCCQSSSKWKHTETMHTAARVDVAHSICDIFKIAGFTSGTGIMLPCTPIFPVCIHCKTKQNP